jgi:hypothetical protein
MLILTQKLPCQGFIPQPVCTRLQPMSTRVVLKCKFSREAIDAPTKGIPPLFVVSLQSNYCLQVKGGQLMSWKVNPLTEGLFCSVPLTKIVPSSLQASTKTHEGKNTLVLHKYLEPQDSEHLCA